MDLLSSARKTSGENSMPYAQASGRGWHGLRQQRTTTPPPKRLCVRRSRLAAGRLPTTRCWRQGWADLAYDLLLQGKTDEPEGILHEALNIVHRLVGEDSSSDHFDTALLGFMHYERGDYVAAEREMRYAVDYLTRRFARDDEDMVGGRVVLGLSLIHLDRPVEGEPYLREALEIAQAKSFYRPAD